MTTLEKGGCLAIDNDEINKVMDENDNIDEPRPYTTRGGMLLYFLQWCIIHIPAYAIFFVAACSAVENLFYADRPNFRVLIDARWPALFVIYGGALAGANGVWWLYRRWMYKI